jgi:hypothetical protein
LPSGENAREDGGAVPSGERRERLACGHLPSLNPAVAMPYARQDQTVGCEGKVGEPETLGGVVLGLLEDAVDDDER